ncbi:MAG: Gfo/Idh/MocA family oxidoreductase [Pirellulales bacterium]
MPTTFRIGVIGHTKRGDYGHGIDTVWKEIPNATIVAVADADANGLAAAAKRLEVEQAFRDYRAMLDQVKPDIVSVCPRWLDQHRDMVVAATERGIHVYMEKPLCRTLREADEMIAACEQTHARVAVAHQTHYSPRVQMVKQLIADGKIGRVLEYRGRGKEDSRGGGEDLWVLGSHIMDLIRMFGGQPQWCFASVMQNGKPVTAADVKDGPEGIGPLTGDAVQSMYRMPDGSTAYFGSHRNATGRISRFGLQILGSAGVLEIVTGFLPSVQYLDDPSWSPGRSKGQWRPVTSAGIDQPEPLADGGLEAGNVAAVKDLIAAIEENRQPKCSIYEARGAIEMIVACFESQRVGGPVELPLANRENPLTQLGRSE